MIAAIWWDDALKLVSFKYIGHGLQFSLMNTLCLLDAEIWLYPKTIGTIWLHELICLLRWLGHVKLLTLVSNSSQNMIIPKETRENLQPPRYDFKHLKLKRAFQQQGFMKDY
ncbi:uncharacterized protein LOC122638567 [Telopea speciosissima]|uniref:uncharacterized protein LOC122638567 n=1 Tax=Telopea speciosissima TaxID=54955 RepID=UPI001CC71449|nr:uncharacterized protein LOC122638567 [Telopea speciosissima]